MKNKFISFRVDEKFKKKLIEKMHKEKFEDLSSFLRTVLRKYLEAADNEGS